MSEIPKLLKQTPKDIEYYCEDDLYIANKSLKEVNAFWDKYKDNEKQFMIDYPKQYEYYLNHLFSNRTYSTINDLNWYNWLHDLLYKVD